MISKLPYDVLEEIIDTVAHTSNYTSLFGLSLTCKSLLPLCRAHIFATMTLVPRNWDVLSNEATPESYRLRSLSTNGQLFRVKIVQSLVKSTPDILKFVRTLHLQSHQSNYNDCDYIELLENFTNLSTLTIGSYENLAGRYVSPYTPKWNWVTFPQSYQSSLAQLIQRSPIRTLSFDNIGDIPRSALKPCANLINLSLFCATFSSHDYPGSVPVRLKELYFRYDIAAASPLLDMTHGLSIVDPTSLETLAFELHTASENGREYEIVRNAACLEELIISDAVVSYTNFLSDVLDCVHPHCYATLTYLRFTIIYRSVAQPNPVPSSILRGRQFSCLERLEIVLDIEDNKYESGVLADLPALDAVLSSPPYRSLRLLHIDCTASYTVTNLSMWDQIGCARFPKIEQSNPTLNFEYITLHASTVESP